MIPVSNFHESFNEIMKSVDLSSLMDMFSYVGAFILILLFPSFLLIFILITNSKKINKEQRKDIFSLMLISYAAFIMLISALVTFPKENFEFLSTVLSTFLIVVGFVQFLVSSLHKTTFKDFGDQEEIKINLNESKDNTKKYMPRRKFH